MSNLEILLEGFQKFQPVAPRIDTLVSTVSYHNKLVQVLGEASLGSIKTWLTAT